MSKKDIVQREEIKAIFEFQRDTVVSLITQIMNSPAISSKNKIEISDRQQYLKDINTITNKVLEKEMEYYIKNFNIKTIDDYEKVIDKLSVKEVADIRENICKETLEEMGR